MVVRSGRWFKSTPTVLTIWVPVVAYAVHNLQIQTSAHFFHGQLVQSGELRSFGSFR